MSNTLDIAALGIGVALGYGLRNELKAAGSVCKNSLLAAATVAAETTAAAVEAAKSPEEKAADTWLNRMDQQIQQGQSNGNSNGQN